MMRVTSSTQAEGCACEVPRAGSTRRDQHSRGQLIATALVFVFGLRQRRRVTVTS